MNKMTDPQKIEKLIALIKYLRKFVGLFLHKEIDTVLAEIKDGDISNHKITDEQIAKAWCKLNHVDWDSEDEEDIYDAVRCKIWCDGAKWMRSQSN